ncbi:MAG: YihY/virulence factor BrkB family protein [Planctomycetes bacterium]|nr:YihY/virulence factor BrkB family protein [Planctomycetota bacterium]
MFRGALFEWAEDKVPRMAAALAFYTLFSLAPVLIIALAIADVFYTREESLQGILQQVQFLIGDDGIAAIRLLIENAPPRERTTPAMLVGLATMFFAATGAFAELQDSLDTIWEVQPKPGLGLVQMARDRILSFAMVLVIAFLLLVSLIISAALTALSNSLLPFMPQQVVVLQALHFFVSFVVITLLFALIFRILPDAKVAWQDVWLGAVVTSLLFGVGKALFGLYLGHSTIGSSYGAAGSLVIVILWTYYSTLILLFGAEITQVQSRLRGAKIVATPIAVHVTEHDRIQQGAPHIADVELSCEDEEREKAAAEMPLAAAQTAAAPERPPPARRHGIVMTAFGLALGWFLFHRAKRG